MSTQIDTVQREIVLVENAHVRPMMGNNILEYGETPIYNGPFVD